MKTQRVADLITDILYSAGVGRIYAPALCRRAEAQLNVTQEGGPWKVAGYRWPKPASVPLWRD